jgi:hypothetical protein
MPDVAIGGAFWLVARSLFARGSNSVDDSRQRRGPLASASAYIERYMAWTKVIG